MHAWSFCGLTETVSVEVHGFLLSGLHYIFVLRQMEVEAGRPALGHPNDHKVRQTSHRVVAAVTRLVTRVLQVGQRGGKTRL